MEPSHKIKSSSLHYGLIQSNLWSTHVLDTMTHNTTSCPFFLTGMILLSSTDSTLFIGQLSFFVLHEALLDYCSGTFLCQLSHSAHCTIYFNMGWQIFSDWSLSFSFIFSTTQLIIRVTTMCSLPMDLKTVPSSVKEQAGSQAAYTHWLTDTACWKPLKSTSAYVVSCQGF